MIISERRQVARKQHTCDECRRPIAPGTVYCRLYGAAEATDPKYVLRFHRECWANLAPPAALERVAS
jgi:hypothetical protein